MNSSIFETLPSNNRVESVESVIESDSALNINKKDSIQSGLESKLTIFPNSPLNDTLSATSASPAKENVSKSDESQSDKEKSLELERTLFHDSDSDSDSDDEDVYFRRKKLHKATEESPEALYSQNEVNSCEPGLNNFCKDACSTFKRISGVDDGLKINVLGESSPKEISNEEAPKFYPKELFKIPCPPLVYYLPPHYSGNFNTLLIPQAPIKEVSKGISRNESSKPKNFDNRKRKNELYNQEPIDRDDTVYIYKLPRQFVNIESLNKVFKKFGSIINLQTNLKQASARIQFSTPEEASKACRISNKLKLSLFSSDKILILSKSNPESSIEAPQSNRLVHKTVISRERILSLLTDKIRKLLEEKKSDKSKLELEIKGIKSLMLKIRMGYELDILKEDLAKVNILI